MTLAHASSAAFLTAASLIVASRAAAETQLVGSLKARAREPVVGAIVVAQNDATHNKARTTTDRWGQYRITNLRPGTYSVTFTDQRFEPETRSSVVVRTGEITVVNARVRPADPCSRSKTPECGTTVVARGSIEISEGCPDEEDTNTCRTPTDVAATVPAAFKPLWLDQFGSSKDTWDALPCDEISFSIGGGLLFVPGTRYALSMFRGGRAELKTRESAEATDYDATFEAEIHLLYFGRLCLLAQRLEFAKLVPHYYWNASDVGGASIAISIDGHRHEVAEAGSSAPVEFWAMKLALESIKTQIDWKRK